MNKSRLPESKPLTPLPPATKAPAQPGLTTLATSDSTEFIVLGHRVHTVANGTIADGAVHVKEVPA